MAHQTYFLCAVAALMGMLFNVFALKIPSAKTRATAANIKFSVSDYFSTEWAALVANIFAIIVALLVLGEAIKFKPEIQGWIVTIFAFYGFTGSSLLIALFGQVSNKINSIVDIKTNKADGGSENVSTLSDSDGGVRPGHPH